MSEKAFLVLPGIEPSVWSHQVTSAEATMGRAQSCHIRLFHGTVSRNHATIWSAADCCFIRDAGSSNGTFVEGDRINESRFSIGATLRLGDVVVHVIGESEFNSNTAVFGMKATMPHRRVGLTEQISALATGLSDAQVRVLKLLLSGYSEKKVAAALSLSQHTVHTHVKNIYRVLGVRSRGELMAAVFAGAKNAS